MAVTACPGPLQAPASRMDARRRRAVEAAAQAFASARLSAACRLVRLALLTAAAVHVTFDLQEFMTSLLVSELRCNLTKFRCHATERQLSGA